MSWAAVAVVERDGALLFVRRTERPADPWSGDMAFPGGFRRSDDADPAATARREAEEEVGLGLGEAIGTLPSRWAFDPRSRRPVRLHAIRFDAPAGDEPRPDPREIAEVRWIARSRLGPPSREWIRVRGVVPWYARVRWVDGLRIWGLTGRILDDVLRSPRPSVRSSR